MNVGDSITPLPQTVHLPRVLGGEIVVRGYPLAMVYAEKIVTAITRGTASTRWRDFADVYQLSRNHPVNAGELATSIRRVAAHRQVELVPLSQALDEFGPIGQQKWAAWRRRQRLEQRLPAAFDEVVAAVILFAEPAISGNVAGLAWDPGAGSWG